MKKQLYIIHQELTPAFTPGTTGNGLVIDTQNFLTAGVNLAVATMTGATALLTLQHGDESDGSDMDNYQPDGAAIVTETLDTTNTNTTLMTDITGSKRYVRYVSTTTGTVSDLGAFVILADPKEDSTWGENIQGVDR